jgi:hypothetical protein
MSYLNKDDFEDGFSWGTFWKVVIIIGAIVIAFGGIGLGAKAIFGKTNADLDRQIFKSTNSYVEGKLDDLASYKFQWTTADNEIAKKAIEDLVRDEYANFDVTVIESDSLKEWLLTIRE